METVQYVQETKGNVSATWVVSKELRQMIAQHAKMEDRSESSLVRQILREHFSRIRYAPPTPVPYAGEGRSD
jgi:hypothetical protein